MSNDDLEIKTSLAVLLLYLDKTFEENQRAEKRTALESFFQTKYDSAHKLPLEYKILPSEIQIAEISLKRLFDIVQQTNIQDQRKFRRIEDVEIKVNNRTYDFFSHKKCKSKWSQNSIIINFVRKLNKLPKALRKQNQRKNLKELKQEMQKRRERVPMDKKLKALKV